jgi:hypothetical protein
MTPDVDGFLDEPPPRAFAVERIKGISLGAKVVLTGAALLFMSLFLTWQNLQVVYEGAGTGTQMLDGWDVWGLLIGFLALGLIGVVLVAKTSDLEFWPDVAWELIVLAVSATIFALVLVKNMTDRNSAWVSYLALAIAGAIVGGALLDWTSERLGRYAVPRRRRRVRPGA